VKPILEWRDKGGTVPINGPKVTITTGKRHNDGKLRWRNFPMFLFKPLIEVGQYGEGKYKTFNFLKGMTANDSLDCLKRHLCAFEDPSESDADPESKFSHLAHVAWNALVCIWCLKTRPELDDRWKGPNGGASEDLRKEIAEEIVKDHRSERLLAASIAHAPLPHRENCPCPICQQLRNVCNRPPPLAPSSSPS